MADYRPPVADLLFSLQHVVGYPQIEGLPGFEHADIATVSDILDECGSFMADIVAPTNRIGDTEGANRLDDGTVVTPESFKAAYRGYVDAGWGGVPLPEQYGGGGFPRTVGLAIQEFMMSSNVAFSLCPLLTQGAIEALLSFGSEEQKDTYLPKMVTGEWSGTMNLTEPQAGSDVGALTTRAVKRDDGSYAITGQKIFITFGDHDLSEQIVHLVLARTPDAPAGTRGISCFIVPKRHVNADGSLGERNSVECLSVEDKLGIHGSPTCVMNYDEATGYLIGEENKGMRIMFIMMNSARLSVGTQGLAIAERAYQQSLSYAQERRQGLAIGASGTDSPIIDHPDVRRMLLTQKASIEGLRHLMYYNAVQTDLSKHGTDENTRNRADEIVGLLTPLCKSLGTDLGEDLTSLALQIHGGMGYIEETGVAQHYRDVRITSIYEGTNGIQAADLIGRKLPVRDGASVMEFIAEMAELDAKLEGAGEAFEGIREELSAAIEAVRAVTMHFLSIGREDPNSVLAGSVPYQRMFGMTVMAWLLAKGALAETSVGGDGSKLVLARFFAEQLLPAAVALVGAATAPAEDLFALNKEQLA